MKKYLLLMLVLLWASFESMGQGRTISGKVTSADDGSSLPGVNVIVKGTTEGTVTDANGRYSLSVSANATLVFSFIGLKTEEIPVGERAVVDVSMSSDVTQLTEVVVTGTGVATEKKRLGIAVESVTSKDLPAAPTASIDQALIGKIAGAQISSTSGNPGDPVNIVLRGMNTVQGGTKPLIIVDGVQMAATDLNSLDLSNIERVEVVQGAASAALYGAQGANGAIQVFTKRGKKGAPVVNYSFGYAENSFVNNGHVSKASLHPYLTDSNNNIVSLDGTILTYNDFGSIEGLSYKYGGGTRYALLDPQNVADQPYNANLKYYDHFKQVFKTGHTINHNINISGANDNTDYAISVSSNQTLTPVMNNGNYDRYNVTTNIGTELFRGFKVRSITQLIYTRNNIDPGLGGAGGAGFGQGDSQGNVASVWGFLNTSPFFDLKYKLPDGTPPAYQYADFVSVNSFNPFYQQYYTSSLDNKIDILQNFDANYKVNKFIELDAKYGINYRTENARWIYKNQTQNINSNYYETWAYSSNSNANTGEVDNWNYTGTFRNFLGSAFLYTNFKDDFNINLPIETSTQVSFDYRKNVYKEYDTYGVGLPLLPPSNMESTSSQAVGLDYSETFITYGYLVNQKITYGDYAGVTGGFRSDWSSAFGGGSKPFTFPHADGFIAPSSFNFWDGIKQAVPYFKLRAAYGEAGIQPGPHDRYPVLDQSNLGSSLVYSLQQTGANPNLKVEVSKEFEAGTDFTLGTGSEGNWFNDIHGSFTYWKRKSENVIYAVSEAPSSGTTGALTNAIGMSSHGIQFQLTMPVYESENFTWDFTTNFGRQTSKIDNISGGADIILTSAAGSTALTLTPGQKIGQIYGFKALTSLDEKKADGTRYISSVDESQYEIVNGRVVNKATKAIQFTEDTHPLGDPNPKFNASFINTFSYKNFLSFSFQFDWLYKSHVYNQLREWMYRDGIHSDFSKPVTIDGKTAAYTAYYESAYTSAWGSLYGPGNNATKDYFYEDASFWRLRNISIGFDLAKVFDLKYFKKLQLVLTGRNIMTFTKYTGLDPEISSGAVNSSFDRGVDNGTLPNTKSYQVGLNVTF